MPENGPLDHRPQGHGPREIIGVFHDERALQTAVDELLVAGFDRSAFSLPADCEAVERELGRAYERAAEIGDEGGAPRIHYIGRDSRVEAQGVAIGVPAYVGATLAAALLAAAGAGILIVLAGAAAAGIGSGVAGAALARYIGRHHSRYLEGHLARGGLLLWITVRDDAQERVARSILERNAAEGVHGHELPAAEYGGLRRGVSRSLSFMNRLGL